MRQEIINEVEKREEELLSISKYLYENPEIAMKEHKSAKRLVDFLRGEGFEVRDKIEGMETGFIASKKNGEGPRIGFVAEYDALPEVGHACGHHLIATMGVGAGAALARVLDDYQGEVTVFGTPAEETGEGKSFMVDQGIFDGMDAVMMVHPFDRTCVDPVEIAIGGLDFVFKGRAAHAGATPHNGINALDAVILFFNNLNALREQTVDGSRIHGIILEAGTAPNIIPEKGVVRLEIRAREQGYFNELLEKVIRCAEGSAIATGCKLEYEHFEPTCDSLDENPVLVEAFRDSLVEFGIEEGEKVISGSTDMGNVSQVVPAIQPVLKFADEGIDIHTEEFLKASVKPFALDMMIKGSKIMALTGLRFFEDEEILERIRASK